MSDELKVEAARIATERFAAAGRQMKADVREAIGLLIRAAIDPEARPGILEDIPPPPAPEPVRYVQATMFRWRKEEARKRSGPP